MKSSVPQGPLWEKAVRRERGDDYFTALQTYYDRLALMVMSRDFVACHAAPPRSRIGVDFLIDVQKYPGMIKELLWNRLKRPNYPAGYTRSDVTRFRKSLDLAPDAPFLVSHNPLNQEDSLWLNAGEIQNHHIVFSGRCHCIGMFTRISGAMVPVRYPGEALLEVVNSLETTQKETAASTDMVPEGA